MRRVIPIALSTILLALVFAFVVGWFYLRTSLPQTKGTVMLPGLDGPVEIVRDENGVPHIFGTTDHDAIFALGYVHAQDRLWQMEMNRRIGSGRLSEVLGEAALDIDKFQRTMGYRRLVEPAYDALSPEGRASLDAYVAGVNAWIDEGHTLPPEFLLLGVKPEPWTVYDSLVWVKMMQWDLGGDYEMELLRAQTIAALGEERAAQILPAYPNDGVDILEEVSFDSRTANELLAAQEQMQDLLGLTGREQGSNDWVIHGSRTETGMPLLADDPHLSASIPSVWYLAELQGDRLHVTGASFPSLPMVVIGHNEKIAWGVTNVNPDVQDLYLERINPANPNQVEVNGEWEEMQVFEESIAVDGRSEPIAWAARATRHGPLISDVTTTASPVSLRWTALDPDDTTLDAYLGIAYASNWDEFKQAMGLYVAPSQNFVYADTEGNIGYFAPGRIPIRKSGDGMLPTPGWNDETAWTGFIPVEELPQAYNPSEGYVATANNRVVDDDYPYLIGNDWSEPYRAERIVELIEAMSSSGESISVEEMATIQADQSSAQVRDLLPFMLGVIAQDDRQSEALTLLGSWDGRATRESAAAAIYSAWRIELERAVIEDDLHGELYEDFAHRANTLFLDNIVNDPALSGVWCNNVLSLPTESCDEIAVVALDRALDALANRMGDKMERWEWQEVHVTQYPHRPFSDVSYLKPFFHRSIGNGGDTFTVNVGPIRLADLYNQYNVPSYRHIVDLQDFNRSVFVTTTGQSGNVMSRHYDDFIERHRDVEYLPMTFGRERVAGETLTLQPE